MLMKPLVPVMLAFLSLPTAPAGADDIVGFYAASWAGLPAGGIRLKLSQDPAVYRDEIGIVSEGLPRWFTKFRGTGTSEGRLASDGTAQPARYDALYDLRKRHDSHISMRFVDRDGAVVAERGPADTSRKPPLPETYRRDVVDPLAALATIRHRLLARPPRAGDKFTLPVYDGARRFDVRVEVVGAGDQTKGDQTKGDQTKGDQTRGDQTPVVRLRLTLQPIAGFKGESAEDEDPDTAPRPVEVSLSDDGKLVPLSMRVSLYLLPLTVEFRHFCPSFAACKEDAK